MRRRVTDPLLLASRTKFYNPNNATSVVLSYAFTNKSRLYSSTKMQDVRPEGSAPIQLYSLATPNGQKVGIALEEMGLEYDAHKIDISKGVQFQEWYVKEVNPNSKIPAIIDKEAEGGPLPIFESGSILIYLAKKTGKFLPQDPRKEAETISWLMWQMGGLGPMTGQMGHFVKHAKVDVPYAKERYTNETKRLWGVLEKQLEGKEYVIGNEYTIADMAIFPWIYEIYLNTPGWKETVGPIPNIERWINTIAARPAVQKGRKVTGW